MANEVVHSHSTYDLIELIGTSRTSWEDAAKNVVEVAAKHLRELRVAEVVKKDLVIRDGKVKAYRTKLNSPLNTKLVDESRAAIDLRVDFEPTFPF
jgi:flavin-binding protein dodecin